jgi:choline-sulfatase
MMVAAATAAAEQPRGGARPPNVLWICADDHAAYVIGAYGNRQVKTPAIDRLTLGGLRFDRAFCNSPVCTASRQSFLTGRYPRTIGVTQLATALPEEETTLAELLKSAGYATAAMGKMHFNSGLSHGFDLRLDLTDHARELAQRGRRPGPAGVEVLPQWRPFRDPASVWLNSRVLPLGMFDEEMPGSWLAQAARRYLRGRGQAPRQPFFLMVSFYEPHSPFHFPYEFAGRHAAARFTAPPVDAADEWQIPAIFRDLTPLQKQGIAAAYYTSVEFLDRNVGLVLEALDQAGLAEETLVIYTGDHGYMLGQHGRFEKHCCYEPAIRAPLVIRWPGRAGSAAKTDALVEFIDIVPTVLDCCGVPAPATVQGQSLVPLLNGLRHDHRDAIIVEYAENEEAAIRTERWKLIYCTGRRDRQDGYAAAGPPPGRTLRLFDLVNDPEERTNLADMPEHAQRVEQLTERLARHMRQTARQPELVPRTHDVHELLEYCLAPRDVGRPN